MDTPGSSGVVVLRVRLVGIKAEKLVMICDFWVLAAAMGSVSELGVGFACLFFVLI